MDKASIKLSKTKALAQLQQDALIVLAHQGKANASVEIMFGGMQDMREMKRTYLGKDQEVVDVLSFPADPAFPGAEEGSGLGDIYLNWDAFKDDFAYLQFLMIHGVLHLLGYAHEEKNDTLAMERLERTLCRLIALPESTSAQQRSNSS